MSKYEFSEEWMYDRGNYVNTRTGEVLSLDEIKKSELDAGKGLSEFVRLYLELVGDKFDFSSLRPNAQKLFWHLVKRMGYAGTKNYVISFGAESKKWIAEELGMSLRSLRDAYYQLRDKEFIIFLAHDTIQLNPFLVARGNTQTINAIRISILKIGDKFYKLTEVLNDGNKAIPAKD